MKGEKMMLHHIKNNSIDTKQGYFAGYGHLLWPRTIAKMSYIWKKSFGARLAIALKKAVATSAIIAVIISTLIRAMSLRIVILAMSQTLRGSLNSL
jgi:hypothetical protein